MSNLNEMNAAPLDGSHIMVVFKDGKHHKIREAWVKTMTETQITGSFEFENDNGSYIEIENPIGWFEIPTNFDTKEPHSWQ